MAEVSEDWQNWYQLEMQEAGRTLKTLGKCSTYLGIVSAWFLQKARPELIIDTGVMGILLPTEMNISRPWLGFTNHFPNISLAKTPIYSPVRD